MNSPGDVLRRLLDAFQGMGISDHHPLDLDRG